MEWQDIDPNSPEPSYEASGATTSKLSEFWLPDELFSVCQLCDSVFTFLNRRHHCRICGRIFCVRCCGSFVHITKKDNLRTCKVCCDSHIRMKSIIDKQRRKQHTSPITSKRQPLFWNSSQQDFRKSLHHQEDFVSAFVNGRFKRSDFNLVKPSQKRGNIWRTLNRVMSFPSDESSSEDEYSTDQPKYWQEKISRIAVELVNTHAKWHESTRNTLKITLDQFFRFLAIESNQNESMEGIHLVRGSALSLNGVKNMFNTFPPTPNFLLLDIGFEADGAILKKREFFKFFIKKAKRLDLSLLIFSGHVDNDAREMLRESNVEVVDNVDAKQMEDLAQNFEISILRSIEDLHIIFTMHILNHAQGNEFFIGRSAKIHAHYTKNINVFDGYVFFEAESRFKEAIVFACGATSKLLEMIQTTLRDTVDFVVHLRRKLLLLSEIYYGKSFPLNQLNLREFLQYRPMECKFLQFITKDFVVQQSPTTNTFNFGSNGKINYLFEFMSKARETMKESHLYYHQHMNHKLSIQYFPNMTSAKEICKRFDITNASIETEHNFLLSLHHEHNDIASNQYVTGLWMCQKCKKVSYFLPGTSTAHMSLEFFIHLLFLGEPRTPVMFNCCVSPDYLLALYWHGQLLLFSHDDVQIYALNREIMEYESEDFLMSKYTKFMEYFAQVDEQFSVLNEKINNTSKQITVEYDWSKLRVLAQSIRSSKSFETLYIAISGLLDAVEACVSHTADLPELVSAEDEGVCDHALDNEEIVRFCKEHMELEEEGVSVLAKILHVCFLSSEYKSFIGECSKEDEHCFLLEVDQQKVCIDKVEINPLFGTAAAVIKCSMHHPVDFLNLRRCINGDECDVTNEESSFLNSLLGIKPWVTNGGKTAASFFSTHDNRYLVKGISDKELEMFHHLKSHYFTHCENNIERTFLLRIIGIYSFQFEGSNLVSNYVIMEKQHQNLIEKSVVFDLKGNVRNRYKIDPLPMDTLLDVNFFEYFKGPLIFGAKADLDEIVDTVTRDADMLCAAGVIDYSLLLHVDSSSKKVSVGIVDYLQQYNYAKQLESNVKKVTGSLEPTIVDPASYRDRFVQSLHRFFSSVPEEENQEIHNVTSLHSLS